jgi:hypothetical protein
MHGILVKVNPENTEGIVSILQHSGQILQPTAKSGLKIEFAQWVCNRADWFPRNSHGRKGQGFSGLLIAHLPGNRYLFGLP